MIEIRTIVPFDKEMKRLRKKYRSLINDYVAWLDELRNNPLMGVDLGDGIRKIRVAIGSKHKGKSGGARIITDTTAIISLEKGVITLLYIYDKSERSNISDKEIKQLKRILKENLTE